jgi:hypothetical protein
VVHYVIGVVQGRYYLSRIEKQSTHEKERLGIYGSRRVGHIYTRPIDPRRNTRRNNGPLPIHETIQILSLRIEVSALWVNFNLTDESKLSVSISKYICHVHVSQSLMSILSQYEFNSCNITAMRTYLCPRQCSIEIQTQLPSYPFCIYAHICWDNTSHWGVYNCSRPELSNLQGEMVWRISVHISFTLEITSASVSWLISPLKSSHFQNCSVLLASFLVGSTSDQVTTDAFGNHLGWMRVFNEESTFISLEKCFCTVFFQFDEVIFTAHAR